MAASGRRPDAPLIEALLQEPHRFDFFQAVRVLERLASLEETAPPAGDRHAVGHDNDPGSEAVRFRAAASLAFPPATIAALRQAGGSEGGKPPEMAVSFLGLTGPSGVLPQYYTELLIRSIRGKNAALRDMLDLFNHRTVSLFYRAWEKYRLPAAYGRGADDPVTASLFALVGLGTGHLRRQLAVDDEAVLFYAGHFAHMPRSASALEAILSDYFERPVAIEQFRGRWLHLAEEEHSALPGAEEPEGLFCQLGVNTVVGDRVWDVQSSFRVKLGPLSYDQFVQFMPEGRHLLRLVHLARLFLGPGLGFDVQLVLARQEVPPCRLGGDGAYEPRLGWNTWLEHRHHPRDADDAVFAVDRL